MIIEDSYKVPEVIDMPESEKICLELLDDLFSSALNGMHILKSVPQTKVVTRVTLDEQRIFLDLATGSRNIRSQSQGSAPSDH